MKIKSTAIAFLVLLVFSAPTAEAKNIYKAGSDITVGEKAVADNVMALFGQITVSGLVEQNVVAVGGSVVLTSKAVVRGKVVVVGGVVAQGKGSLVYGDITEINSATLSEAFHAAMRGDLEGWSIILNIISVCFFAIILMIALIMTLIVPRSLAVIANAISTNLLKSFFTGFLVTLMIVPFFMLLAISIIGIFLIPLAFAALILAAIIGFTAVGSLVGNFVITKIFRGYRKSLLKETLVGLGLLWILGMIPFYAGMLMKVVAITCGLGGVILALSRRKTAL